MESEKKKYGEAAPAGTRGGGRGGEPVRVSVSLGETPPGVGLCLPASPLGKAVLRVPGVEVILKWLCVCPVWVSFSLWRLCVWLCWFPV